jgi:hypothetical protein
MGAAEEPKFLYRNLLKTEQIVVSGSYRGT